MNRFQIKYILWKRKASTYHLDSFVEQSSGAHLGMILAMSGDTFVCHSVGAPGIRWMEVRDAAQQPAVQRRPQWKVIQPKMPTMPRLSNSGTDSLFKNFFDLKWDLTIDITGQFAFSPCHLEPWAALPRSFYHQPGFLCPESTTSCIPGSQGGSLDCLVFRLQSLAFLNPDVFPVHTGPFPRAGVRRQHSKALSPWSPRC